MPRIPRGQFNTVTRSALASPEALSRPYRALAQAGEQVERVGAYGFGTFTEIEQREKAAERALKALQIENSLRDDIDQAAESYYDRIDYGNFEEDAGEKLKAIQSKYKDLVGDDQVLGLAFEKAFSSQSSALMRVVRDKKRQVIAERGKGQLEISFNQALKDYSKEMSPENREITRTQLQMKALSLVNSHIITLKEAEATIQRFDDEADSVRADQWIEADPESALTALKGGDFDDLDPKIKQAKIEKAEAAIKTNEREERANDERMERRLAQIRKDVVDQNELDMWEAYYNDTLKESDLDKLADNRMISESTYRMLKEKINKEEKGENNAVIVGDISEAIELRNPDARRLVDEAHESGDIKTETYISMRKDLATKAYSDGLSYINRAMQPGELDIDFYRKQKHADAVADYSIRVSNGEDPLEVAKDIVKLNRSNQIQTFSRYRDPRYLSGAKNDTTALNQAKLETIRAYQEGKLSPDEYNNEIELIENILKAISDMERFDQTQDQLDSETQKVKVKK